MRTIFQATLPIVIFHIVVYRVIHKTINAGNFIERL